MIKGKVLLYSTNRQYQAELLRNLLADNNIHCFIINKKDSAYLFGDIELYVNPEDFMRAKLLTDKFEEK